MNITPTRFSLGNSLRLAALGVSILLMSAACAGIETEGFSPIPTTKSLPEKTKESAELDDISRDPGSTDENEDSEGLTEELPEFLYPDGTKVALTAPGTVLRFGESATVATSDSEGRLLIWKINAHDGVRIPAGRIKLLEPEKATNISHFNCYAYDIEFLGAVSKYREDPMVIHGLPDINNTAVTPPKMIASSRDDKASRRLVGGSDNACGIPLNSRLPTKQSSLVRNFSYARGTVGAVEHGSETAESSHAVSFYFDEEAPPVPEGRKKPEPIIWR